MVPGLIAVLTGSPEDAWCELHRPLANRRSELGRIGEDSAGFGARRLAEAPSGDISLVLEFRRIGKQLCVAHRLPACRDGAERFTRPRYREESESYCRVIAPQPTRRASKMVAAISPPTLYHQDGLSPLDYFIAFLRTPRALRRSSTTRHSLGTRLSASAIVFSIS
jgi:hypothetical protein